MEILLVFIMLWGFFFFSFCGTELQEGYFFTHTPLCAFNSTELLFVSQAGKVSSLKAVRAFCPVGRRSVVQKITAVQFDIFQLGSQWCMERGSRTGYVAV